jgi:hypothetical protein
MRGESMIAYLSNIQRKNMQLAASFLHLHNGKEELHSEKFEGTFVTESALSKRQTIRA